MTPTTSLFDDDRRVMRRLQQRDHRALLMYAASWVLIVMAGEAAAFYLGMADRHGFLPMLFRGIAYLLVTLALWAALLRANRHLVSGLMSERRQGYESVLRAYDGALSLKDAYTGGHGRRVARYARVIAEAMALPEAEVDAIGEAALLHDLGKIGVPDRILTKPAQLTSEEFAIVQKHPGAGAGILRAIEPLREHAAAVHHHHERFDGNGYPDRLRGTDIPIAARIIAVADTLDALSSDRSYRQSVGMEAAFGIIMRASGSRFDPAIVAAISAGPTRAALLAAHREMT
ncbi:MAG TPA: HD domain-containing protein [Thiobacillaceae bacterium]|nr:HD domain-containing protein [Thiobacillaceae bacterium]